MKSDSTVRRVDYCVSCVMPDGEVRSRTVGTSEEAMELAARWSAEMRAAVETLGGEPGPTAASEAEIRLDDDGELDEVVGGGTFHLERMSKGCWWMRLGDVRVVLSSKRRIEGFAEREAAPSAPALDPVTRELRTYTRPIAAVVTPLRYEVLCVMPDGEVRSAIADTPEEARAIARRWTEEASA